MPIDVWFPLAIYYVDLPDSAAHQQGMIDSIRSALQSSATKRTSEQAAWTGDVHSVDQIHLNPAFAWITSQIGLQAFEYLKVLGHDLSRTELYIQRSWPVVSRRGQFVNRHAHHTADVSAVYYVSVPEGNAGQTRFFNDARQNELCGGLSSNMTSAYSQSNPLNYQSAVYTPIEGRLLLFPAKQTHDVLVNETDGERISISFDLILTSPVGDAHRGYEFLMPPPELWAKVPRPAVPPETSTET